MNESISVVLYQLSNQANLKKKSQTKDQLSGGLIAPLTEHCYGFEVRFLVTFFS